MLGVPFVVAPFEAEAQCAYLESEGLVDGVITEDSDAFLFGASTVYRHFFSSSKHVEVTKASDIETELGLDRDRLISLALLLGGDYTEGIHGVGIVNAIEIVLAFPGIHGLSKFKRWLDSFAADAMCGDKAFTHSTEYNEAQRSFFESHAGYQKRWIANDGFPSREVAGAYLKPHVDRSKKPFSWATPRLDSLARWV